MSTFLLLLACSTTVIDDNAPVSAPTISIPVLQTAPPAGTDVPTTTAGHQLTFVNNCAETVWVGSIGNSGFSGLGGGGWAMPTKSTQIEIAPVGWQGRFWPRTGCTFDAAGNCPTSAPCCTTGSCLESDDKTFGLACGFSGTPPVSLVEPTFDAAGGLGPYDDYDISFVDGWSVPVSMVPDAGTYNPVADPGLQAPWCKLDGCSATPACPYPVAGDALACSSPCQNAMATPGADVDNYCCVCSTTDGACDCASSQVPGGPKAGCCDNSFGCTPDHTPMYPADLICDPTGATNGNRPWDAKAQGYIKTIHDTCPGVYAWQFDDVNGSFQCRKTDGLVNYTVTFCPIVPASK